MRRTTRRAHLVVCAALSIGSADAQSLPVLERVLTGASPGYAVRPRDLSEPSPVTVYLHGLCGEPLGGCSHFRARVSGRSWLLCPTAPRRSDVDCATWSVTAGALLASIRRVLDAAERLAPGRLDRARPGVLIGFSQGAYAVAHLLREAPGRWRGVVFIGGFIRIGRARLEALGVRRAVFAAGRYDMTRRTLEETTRRLREEGFPARFVDLGAVGHTFVSSRAVAGWRDALAWVEESY